MHHTMFSSSILFSYCIVTLPILISFHYMTRMNIRSQYSRYFLSPHSPLNNIYHFLHVEFIAENLFYSRYSIHLQLHFVYPFYITWHWSYVIDTIFVSCMHTIFMSFFVIISLNYLSFDDPSNPLMLNLMIFINLYVYSLPWLCACGYYLFFPFHLFSLLCFVPPPSRWIQFLSICSTI